VYSLMSSFRIEASSRRRFGSLHSGAAGCGPRFMLGSRAAPEQTREPTAIAFELLHGTDKIERASIDAREIDPLVEVLNVRQPGELEQGQVVVEHVVLQRVSARGRRRQKW